VWVYPLRTKDEVYEKFREWKAMVELATGKRLKVIRTDNGGEHTCREFETYLNPLPDVRTRMRVRRREKTLKGKERPIQSMITQTQIVTTLDL